jgi:putative transposase
MARLPRLVLPGHAHHLVQRGHNLQPVFADDDDRRNYLTALHEAARAHTVAVHAYALLPNQVQLLLTPPTDAALSRTMQALGRRYVAAYNRRHGRSGTLWEGRFRAGVVQPGTPTLQSLQSIDTLAMRHGQAASPQTSLWTSAPHRLGKVRDPLITDPAEFWQLGNTPFEREAAYRALLERGLDDASRQRIEHAAVNGWALGSPAFLAQVAQALGRPARPRAPGRPPRSGTQSASVADRKPAR